MAATPQYGTAIFVNRTNGERIPVDLYVSDVAAAKVRWDEGGGASATASEFITFPYPVLLEDFSIITGTADTEKIRLTAGGSPLRQVLRYDTHLSSLATRPALNIPFNAGTRIGGFQIAD